MKATDLTLEMLKKARRFASSAHYVLFDTWFCFPTSLIEIKKLGFDVIAMARKSPKVRYCFDHEEMPLTEIYKGNKKRRGRSRYLLSVIVQVSHDNDFIPAKVVYVRDRTNRKKYLGLISTDTSLSEDEIIRLYGKRWNIEIFVQDLQISVKTYYRMRNTDTVPSSKPTCIT